MANSRHKITLEFATAQAASEWFDAARAAGHIPEGADLFKADNLDLARGGDPRTYVVRPIGERSAELALRTRS